MLTIALTTIRTRRAAFAATFAALSLGVSVIATMALVLAAASGGGPHQRPQRFAVAPAVVRMEPAIRLTDRYGTTDTVPVPEQPGIPASVVDRFPGAAVDRTC
jgi:putative ABC transport system permease protein